MKGKGLFLLLLFALVFTALGVGSLNQAQAASSPAEIPAHPPICYPIDFFQEGYYGIYCLDAGNDITTVKASTNCPYTLNWDNTYVQLIVEEEEGMYVYWIICDEANSCKSGWK